MTIRIDSCGASHVGRVRRHNEDNIYLEGAFRRNIIADNAILRGRRKGGPSTYAVFDGLGGENGGEEASLIAAMGLYDAEKRGSVLDVATYIQVVNQAIIRAAELDNCHGMGTTVALAHIDEDVAYISNVGDSRCYLLREGIIQLLTKDHSVVQSLIDYGIIGEDDRYTNKHTGELTQYIGMIADGDIEPEVYTASIRVKPGDILMLCSDGLTGELRDEEIRQVMMREAGKSSEHMVLELIKQTLDKGGRDNISVIVCRIECEQE